MTYGTRVPHLSRGSEGPVDRCRGSGTRKLLPLDGRRRSEVDLSSRVRGSLDPTPDYRDD